MKSHFFVGAAGVSQATVSHVINNCLMKDIGCPNGLSAVGYTEADIPMMVEGGWKQQRLLVGSPRPLAKEDLERILAESMLLW